MDNQFLLNPFFLDSPAPLLNRLLKPAWIVNRPAIGGSSQPARIQAIHAPLVERVGAVAAAGIDPCRSAEIACRRPPCSRACGSPASIP